MKFFFKPHNEYWKKRSEGRVIQREFPSSIPVILEKGKTSKLPGLRRTKFLLPCDLTFNQFSFVVRSILRLEPDSSLFLVVDLDREMPPGGATFQQLYKEYRRDDYFLYITYSEQKNLDPSYMYSFVGE